MSATTARVLMAAPEGGVEAEVDSNLEKQQDHHYQQQQQQQQQQRKDKRRQRRRSSISGSISSSNRQQQHQDLVGEDKSSSDTNNGTMRRKKSSGGAASRSLSPITTLEAKIKIEGGEGKASTRLSASSEAAVASGSIGEPDSVEKPKRKLLLMPVENNIEDPELLPIEDNIEDPDDEDNLPFDVAKMTLNNNKNSRTAGVESEWMLPIKANIEDPDDTLLPTESNIEDPDDEDSDIEDPDESGETITSSDESSSSSSSSSEWEEEEQLEEEQETKPQEENVIIEQRNKNAGKEKIRQIKHKTSRSLSPVNTENAKGAESATPSKMKKSKKGKKSLPDRASRSLSPMRPASSPAREVSKKDSKQKTSERKTSSSPSKKKRGKDKKKSIANNTNNNKKEKSPFSERKRKMKMSMKASTGTGDPAARPMTPGRSSSSSGENTRSPRKSTSIRKTKSMDDDDMLELEALMEQKHNAVAALSPVRMEQRRDRQTRRTNRRASLTVPMVGPQQINTMPAINTNVANFVNEERKEMRRASRRASLSGPMGSNVDNSSSVMDRRKMENEKRAYIRARMRGETPVAERGNLIRNHSAPPMRRLKSILYTRETPRRNGSFNVKFAEEDPIMFVIPDLTNQERTELYYSRKDIKMFKIDDINRKQREIEMEEQEKKKG